MADEAFALSPISARAAQPNEEDYDAIHTAFMETSRGRWFLGEYAKRNRNADTRLVLDAVARIEQGLSAQKEAAAEADLTEALAAIREAVTEAQAAANAGLEGLAIDERLAPIAKGLRIIREISWRWRETGADGRICDILDAQVAAIESSTGQISVDSVRAAVDQAFAEIDARIDEYSPGSAEPPQARREAEDVNVVRFPAPAEEAAESETATAAEASVAEELAVTPEAGVAEAAAAIAEPVAEAATPIAAVVEAIEFVDEAVAGADDEALLDLIAAEMSAPQSIDDDNDITIAETAATPDIGERAPFEPETYEPKPYEPKPYEPKPAAPRFETAPVAAAARPAPPAVAATSASGPAPAPTLIGEAELSVGSAVIASGILNKPKVPANDPLAPIRRMSQAEKIAFFS